jgi:hypothetical protein
MRKNGWFVKRYNFKTKTRKEENENDLYIGLFDANEKEGFHSILLLNLMDQYGLTNHFISICDNYIFDSNFIRALTLSENNLDACCGTLKEKKTCCGFGLIIELHKKI